MLYAFSSAGNNNGSAFARPEREHAVLQRGTGHGDVDCPLLAGDSDAGDRRFVGGQEVHAGQPGTLPTHTPLFVVMLAGIVLLVGALTFIPALALGPIVEQLQMMQ